ncbi:MAG: hypothetical protein HYY78_01855 [Betaproteobacteria bacterium]|nr:hypothetical protein [Betaproteobacteria bacterium]
MERTDAPAPDELAGYINVADWLDRHAGPFFETRSSLDWFIKRNRLELVERGALLPREGRSGSLLSVEKFPKAVVEILRRRALDKVRPDCGKAA